MNRKMMNSGFGGRMLVSLAAVILATGMVACNKADDKETENNAEVTVTVAAEGMEETGNTSKNGAAGEDADDVVSTGTGASNTTSTDIVSTEGTAAADTVEAPSATEVIVSPAPDFEGTGIVLSDDGITVNGEAVGTDSSEAVYVGEDIVYYEEGKDETYGEGSEDEAHSSEEAAEHTVLTITKAGSYELSGKLSKGQICIDLGSEAKEDENAVVNLYLNNADITCTVAPAIVVVKAYECGNKDTEAATPTVDTQKAGFNLILADDSVNTVNGSHVAKIYEEGTTDKKYKYDAAISSKVSFNINGGKLGNGLLTVNADNEGIESGCHMTVNGGEIVVNSGDDAINTNEDSVSVLTINGGIITCDSGGGSEGDGIDSNGYIVVNGGYMIACANAKSQDSGVDSDLGIYINGGTVLATGNMYDEVKADSAQTFMVLNFAENVSQDSTILIKDSEGNAIKAFNAVNDYTMLVYSSPDLTEGDYTLYEVTDVKGDSNGSIYTNIMDYKEVAQLQYTAGGMMGGFGGRPGGTRPEMPADGEMPEMPADGERPEMPADGTQPEMPADGEVPEMPADGTQPEMPADGTRPEFSAGEEQATEGEQSSEGAADAPDGTGGRQQGGGRGGFGQGQAAGEATTVFNITLGNNTFSNITKVTTE